jgi:DNA helicase II / ATP-dependent DNA helicase PcrA
VGAVPDISCGCCGGSHSSVAEVRRCCTDGPSAPPNDASFGPAPAVPRAQGSLPIPGGPTPHGPVPDGPVPGSLLTGEPPLPRGAPVPLAELGPLGGRSMVLAPGAPCPPGWKTAEADGDRIVIDDEVLRSPGAVIDELQRRWSARMPSVIEVRAELPDPATERRDGPAHRFEPSMEFIGERLQHLVWSHSVDGRDPDHPRLAGLAGWTPGHHGDLAPVGVPPTAEGRPVLVDGGPLRSCLADPGDPDDSGHSGHSGEGMALLPRFAAQRGHLAPLRSVASTAALAEDQLAAVAHEGGAARIIAPAGSGKTRVLTERARLLADGWGVPVEAMCLVAFNVRAAGEMRTRLGDVAGLDVRTLNSLGLAVLSGAGRFGAPPGTSSAQRRPEVIDEGAVRAIIGRLVDLPRRANTDPAAAWIEALAQVRLGLRPPAEVEADYQGDLDGFVEFFDRYRTLLLDQNKVDFDEQIYRAVELLAAEPPVRGAAQRACRVLLVDEFQDLTPAHLTLLRLVAAPAYDVFGVGDDDQTIYGYTGADPGWLIDYGRYFPGAHSHALHTNYRCPPAIVSAASCLLTHNRRRLDKLISAVPGRPDDAEDLHVAIGDDPDAAAVAAVARLLEDGAAPDDIAVLCRVNSVLAPVQVGLTEAGIACTTPVDLRFMERTGVRSALAWLTVAQGRWSAPAVVRETARRPSRGIAPKVVDWMSEQHDLDGMGRLAGRLRERDAAKVEAWYDDALGLSRLAQRGATTTELLEHIRDQVGLTRATDTLDRARRSVDRSSHHDDLDALVALGRMQPDPAAFASWLADRLRPVSGGGGRSGGDGGDGGGRDPHREAPAGRVLLSTIHRVKGQEWPHVLVGNVNDGLLPHRLSTDLEEERRLLHVAVTRASVSCTVLASADRPSPMLDQLRDPWVPRATTGEPPTAGTGTARPGASGSGDGGGAPGDRRGRRGRSRPQRPQSTVQAVEGLELEHGGYRLTVIEVTDDGAVATTGRSRTTLTFGTEVRVDGTVKALAAPGHGGRRSTGAGGDAGAATVGTDAPDADALRDALRSWRLERCRTDNVPAYVVFTDATLEDVVARRPETLDGLLACRGIGPAKVERYGDEILAVLADALG